MSNARQPEKSNFKGNVPRKRKELKIPLSISNTYHREWDHVDSNAPIVEWING